MRWSEAARAAKRRVQPVVDPLSKTSFVLEQRPGSRLLDVGCGNHSPSIIKGLNPSLFYYGIDIGRYFLDEVDVAAADELHICNAEAFAGELRRWGPSFDAIICSHTIEHVADPSACMISMAWALNKGGRIHMTFPSEESVHFPHRQGCLNFYDDPTHREPPDPEALISIAAANGLRVRAASKPHRPFIWRSVGRLTEPLSSRSAKVMRGTWAYWGFENLLVFEKANQ